MKIDATKAVKLIPILIFLHALTACGGGGSGSEDQPSPSIDGPQGSSSSIISIPKDPNALGMSERCVLVWDNVYGADAYNIYWSTNSQVTRSVFEGKERVNSALFSHGNLANGTSYYYLITATANNAESDPSNMESCTPKPLKIKSAESAGFGGLLLSDRGNVWAWPDDYVGTPVPVRECDPIDPDSCDAYLDDVESIGAGYSHYGAIKSDGTVWMWGANHYGASGGATTLKQALRIDDIDEIIAIALGYNHTLALKRDGTVWAWGNNEMGQLGAESSDLCSSLRLPCSLSPLRVGSLNEVVAIAAGYSHSVAVTADGKIWTWGLNFSTQLGYVTSERCGSYPCGKVSRQVENVGNVIDVTAGGVYTVALKSDGTVWAWGGNGGGQLGDGTWQDRVTPTPIPLLTNTKAIETSLSDLGGRAGFTFAVSDDGSVWSWGGNGEGQLGIGSRASQNMPKIISTLSNIEGISAGRYHVFALNSGDELFAWGSNKEGQLADGRRLQVAFPEQVEGLDKAVSVAGGSTGYAVLKQDKTVASWGSGVTQPFTVSGLPAIDKIFASNYRYFGIDTAGHVWEWGENIIQGRIDGINDPRVIQQCLPLESSNCSGEFKDVIEVANGIEHTLALKSDGTVWAWGKGVLGDGMSTSSETPLQVCDSGELSSCDAYLMNVVAIAAGYDFSFALKNDGTLWAWGKNDRGNLGLGDNFDQSTPVQITSLNNVIAISSSQYHTLALKEDGTIWAWGHNNSGALGNSGSIIQGQVNSPQQVDSLNDVVTISAAAFHSLAQTRDGKLWAWGSNRRGALGLGSTELTPVPAELTMLGDVVNFSAAGHLNFYSGSIAIKRDGTVWVWGDNRYGQLGDGSILGRKTPNKVVDL